MYIQLIFSIFFNEICSYSLEEQARRQRELAEITTKATSLYSNYINMGPNTNQDTLFHSQFKVLSISGLEIRIPQISRWSHARIMGNLLKPGFIDSVVPIGKHFAKFRVSSYDKMYVVMYHITREEGIWTLFEEQRLDQRLQGNYRNFNMMRFPQAPTEYHIRLWYTRHQATISAYQQLNHTTKDFFVTRDYRLHGPGGSIQPTADELIEHFQSYRQASIRYVDYVQDHLRPKISAVIGTADGKTRVYHYRLRKVGQIFKVEEEFTDGDHIDHPIHQNLNVLRYGNVHGFY